jgi:hypothetical protein
MPRAAAANSLFAVGGREPSRGAERPQAVRETHTLEQPERRAGAPRDDESAPGWGAGDAVLGRYTLERLLGTGGFGAVWRARDGRLQRPVAVKVIPRTATAGPRVRREALAAARLNHPAIVALYESGEDEDALYLVSELVEGRTLADLEADGALSDRGVARLGLALCDALAHAHAHGVIHRDVKPQNVLVARRGSEAAAKLADFGIAHLVGDEPLTRTGDVVGTLAYMAPEQAGGRRAGAPADLYALGLLLYEALAGVNPVRGQTPAATARRVGRPLPPLRRLRRDLPAPLCAALDRSVRPRPGDRGALAELRAALEEAAPALDDEDGRGPRGAARPPSARRVPGRALAAVAAGGLVALALVRAGPVAPSPVIAVAVLAALLVAAAPRAGWLAVALGTVAWVAGERPGEAVLMGAALLAPPLLLPRDGRWWSAPAVAPLLGLAGLAPAFLALAAAPRRPLAQAGLGAAGFWWLAIAETLLGRNLHLGRVEGVPRSAAGLGATDAMRDALGPLLGSGILAGALLWALAAVVLAQLVRRASLVLAAAGAAAWAAGLVLATGVLADGLGGSIALPEPRGTIAGAALAAALAVAGRALWAPLPPRPAANQNP